MPRRNRRAPLAPLPAIPLGFFDDVEGVYEVTVSNNSGCKRVTVNGTQESVWGWAAESGRQGGFGPGRWEPKTIRLIEAHDERQAFVALV